MTLESILRSIREIFAYIPWPHWVAIGVLTLAVVLWALWRSAARRSSFYGAVALGIAVFAGLLFIETTVVIRWCGIVTNGWGVHLNLDFKRLLFLHSQGYESLFNIFAFVPFGFFLAEYLSAKRRGGTHQAVGWRSFAIATLTTLALSLIIECLQLALHVGFFELTDLIMNTLGGLLGVCLSLLLRAIFSPSK